MWCSKKSFSNREREREREDSDKNAIKYDIIYIDPPYNTEASFSDGNFISSEILPKKFIYRDKFSRNGWLNLLNERLKLAKNLLKDDGIIFVSIDDNEQAYLKVLMDEIFGEENFVSTFSIISNSSGRQVNTNIAICHEYLLVYKTEKFVFEKIEKNYANEFMPVVYPKRKAKSIQETQPNYKKNVEYDSEINQDQEKDNYILQNYLENSNGEFNSSNRPNLFYPIYVKKIEKPHKNSNLWDIRVEKPDNELNFVEIWPRKNGKNVQLVWRWEKNTVKKQADDLVIIEPKDGSNKNYRIQVKKFDQSYTLKSFILGKKFGNKTATNEFNKIFSDSTEKVFNFPKPVELIKFLINLHPNKNAKVLDFFAGSGTTGQAVLELNKQDGGNRNFVLVTNNENQIGEKITFERLYRINFGQKSPQNLDKDKEIDWTKNNKPFKSNLNTYRINYYDVSVFGDDKILIDLAKKFKKMLFDFDIIQKNKDFSYEIEIIRALKSLKPQREIDE
ncbi:site-specific DNA-methyltransferase [Mycoplasma sp. 'Moose RK']|uniref:site-specific DNA-methyltransferase n=1 Tax=Mycoplasma sp. 'Moose RK' TaxID=2780095 RepID=UPI00280AF999|nr:site-specific DNA-methyltransferase [Mycoplasma sp. 'Moose RK']